MISKTERLKGYPVEAERIQEGCYMRKTKIAAVGFLIFSIWLFVSAALEFLLIKQIGIAIGSVGCGIFFLSLSLIAYEKYKKQGK